MIDLSVKSHISQDERLEIAQAMQIFLLDEIAVHTRWRVGEAAFHGGTSISSAWSSQRWSEDLDFLLSAEQRASLKTSAPKVASGIRLRMATLYPGSKIDFTMREGKDDADDIMDVWLVRWTHANRIGKVLVKAEFYSTQPDLMKAYYATLARPSHRRTNVSVVMPVGDLSSLWADKVKVIATRDHFKWRDAHDLGFVADSLDRKGWPEQERLIRSLEISSGIYGKTLLDVRSGLQERLAEGHFENTEEFLKDMERWFSSELYADLNNRGLFIQLLTRAGQEATRAVDLISSWKPETDPSKEMQP